MNNIDYDNAFDDDLYLGDKYSNNAKEMGLVEELDWVGKKKVSKKQSLSLVQMFFMTDFTPGF